MTVTAEAPYSVLLAGDFAAAAVKIIWDANPHPVAKEMQKAADAAWAQLTPNPHFNGRIARLEDWAVEDGSLILRLCPTEYKTLLYSNRHVHEIVRRWGEQQVSNALGISAIVLTRDNYIILMLRSHRVGEYPGFYDVFGGHIDAAEEGVPPDPFVSMAKELKEELLLQGHDYGLRCFGLIRARAVHKPELLFIADCSLDHETVISAAQKAPDGFEYSNLITIKAGSNSIAGFLRRSGKRTSPSAVGALELFAATQSQR